MLDQRRCGQTPLTIRFSSLQTFAFAWVCRVKPCAPHLESIARMRMKTSENFLPSFSKANSATTARTDVQTEPVPSLRLCHASCSASVAPELSLPGVAAGIQVYFRKAHCSASQHIEGRHQRWTSRGVHARGQEDHSGLTLLSLAGTRPQHTHHLASYRPEATLIELTPRVQPGACGVGAGAARIRNRLEPIQRGAAIAVVVRGRKRASALQTTVVSMRLRQAAQ